MSSIRRTAGASILAVTSISVVLAGCGSSSKKTATTSTGSTAPVAATSQAGGSSGGSGGGGVPANPCVLTAAEVSGIVGENYASAKSGGNGLCNYSAPTSNDPSKGSFFTIIKSGASDTAWKDAVATLKEDAGTDPTPISGIGDRAEGDTGAFIVQAKGVIIDVHGELGNGDTDWTPFEAVAKAVLAKL